MAIIIDGYVYYMKRSKGKSEYVKDFEVKSDGHGTPSIQLKPNISCPQLRIGDKIRIKIEVD